MEPQLIDCYNDEPQGVYIINKLNEEYEEVLKKNKQLEEKSKYLERQNDLILQQCKKYKIPPVKISSINEYDIFSEKVEAYEQFVKDIMTSIEDDGDDISRVLSEDYITYNDTSNKDTKSETYIYKMIQELNEMTGNNNYEWCENHILTRVEKMVIRHVSWIIGAEEFTEGIMETNDGFLSHQACYTCEKCGRIEESIYINDLLDMNINELLCSECMPNPDDYGYDSD